jgi:hypothetical protein
MVVGSAASALQGAPIEPGDIDFLGSGPDAMERLAEAMTPFAPEGDAPGAPGTDGWHSTRNLTLLRPGPDAVGEAWHFGRWHLKGCKVEAAYIRPAQPVTTLVEVYGEPLWAAKRTFEWRGRQVPVVPLEVQLATMLIRAKHDERFVGRAKAAARTLIERGHDREMLRRALQARDLSETALTEVVR